MRRQRNDSSSIFEQQQNVSFSPFFKGEVNNNQINTSSNNSVETAVNSFTTSPIPIPQKSAHRSNNNNNNNEIDDDDEECEEEYYEYEWLDEDDDYAEKLQPKNNNNNKINNDILSCVLEIVDDDDDMDLNLNIDDASKVKSSCEVETAHDDNKSKIEMSTASSSARSSVTVIDDNYDGDDEQFQEIIPSVLVQTENVTSKAVFVSSPPCRSSSHSLPLPSSSLIEKALGIWKNATAFVDSAVVVAKSRNHYSYLSSEEECGPRHDEDNLSSSKKFCYSLIQENFIQKESNALLMAIRKVHNFLHFLGDNNSSCNSDEVKVAFMTIIRLVVKDLRLFPVLLSCFASPAIHNINGNNNNNNQNKLLLNEADYCLHVILGKIAGIVNQQENASLSSSAACFAQEYCFHIPALIVENLIDKFRVADDSTHVTIQQLHPIILQKMLDLILQKLDKFSLSFWNFKDKLLLTQNNSSSNNSANGEDGNLNFEIINLFAKEFAILKNPDRLAICTLVKLFSLIVQRIIVPNFSRSNNGDVLNSNNNPCSILFVKVLKNWIVTNCPVETMEIGKNITANKNDNHSSNQQSTSSLSLSVSKNLRRFRIFSSRVDQTVSSEMIRCWSALAKVIAVN